MTRKSLLVLCAAALVLTFSVPALTQPVSVEESFRKDFPRIKIDSISPTDIKGIYEIVAGESVGYYAPEPGYLIVGDIRSKEGVSITQARKNEILKKKNEIVREKAKGLPLDKAIKIGSGKSTVVEFTNPDCSYCREASVFLNKKNGVTRYVFFLAPPKNEKTTNKIKYIFCSPDRVKAYEEAMNGDLDDRKYEVCTNKETEALLKLHGDLGAALDISGTPFFIANDTVVRGADTAEIDAALNKNGVK